MASNIPVIVQGNSFSLAIPLQIYVIQDGEMVLQDYTPDPTDDVSIQLKGTRRNYIYTPSMAGNIATIDLSGNELADNYAVVVSIVKANGQRLRSFRTDQFFIVESSDDLTVDDIIQGLEENVIYLNAQAFISLGEVVISDSTITYDANSALSAKQGVILRQNIELLLSSLGEYAFPDGKPSLDWGGGTLAVTLNLTDFSSSNMAETTQRGSAYTTTLTPAHSSNLYVNEVVIMMGDEDITATAYNAFTGVVNIAEVTGAIEITASQETYVQDGLVLHLDGKNRGGTSGIWQDIAGSNNFTLNNVTEGDDGVTFKGVATSYGDGSAVDVGCDAGTIEVVIDALSLANGAAVLANPRLKGIAFVGWNYNGSVGYVMQTIRSASDEYNGAMFLPTNKGAGAFSINKDAALVDGVQVTPTNSAISWSSTQITSGHSRLGWLRSDKLFNGTIKSIRVYNRKLTFAEMTTNYNIDKKRFNLA